MVEEKKNWFIKLCNWVASFFNAKGDGSSKRATVFAFVILDIYINVMFNKKISDEYWLMAQQIVNKVTILLILGVATVQSVIEFVRIIKNQKPNNDDTGATGKTDSGNAL